jgi:MoxR-like ATPase
MRSVEKLSIRIIHILPQDRHVTKTILESELAPGVVIPKHFAAGQPANQTALPFATDHAIAAVMQVTARLDPSFAVAVVAENPAFATLLDSDQYPVLGAVPTGFGSPGGAVHSCGVKWENLRGIDEGNPCGLVGLGAVMHKAAAALSSGKHVILIGPPGTGKTELAECLCTKLSVQFDLATATAEWTTFDTIGGYFPIPSGPGASEGKPDPINFLPAIVLQSIAQGRWLIIDEINRADIDKAFGELFTFLLGKTVRLPFKNRRLTEAGEIVLEDIVLTSHTASLEGTHEIVLPADWRLIGTMNTFDKASLNQMSYAFMRRFAFIAVDPPAPSDFAQLIARWVAELNHDPTGSAFWAEAAMLLTALFCSVDEERSLAAVGVPVGPSIAKDIIQYVEKRRLLSSSSLEPAKAIIDAAESFLYPQFEGHDSKHSAIAQAIGNACGLSDDEARRTARALATWTGVNSGNEFQ